MSGEMCLDCCVLIVVSWLLCLDCCVWSTLSGLALLLTCWYIPAVCSESQNYTGWCCYQLNKTKHCQFQDKKMLLVSYPSPGGRLIAWIPGKRHSVTLTVIVSSHCCCSTICHLWVVFSQCQVVQAPHAQSHVWGHNKRTLGGNVRILTIRKIAIWM